MTKDNIENNQTNPDNSDSQSSASASEKTLVIPKKTSFGFLKLIIIFALFLVFFVIYNKKKSPSNIIPSPVKERAAIDDGRDDNLLDLADDIKNHPESETTIHDINISEIKEKGAEFIYQLLIKNQVQIEDLNNQLRVFKESFNKFKALEKVNKLVISYYELREKLFSGQNAQIEIESFDLLIAGDEILQKNFTILKNNHSNFPTHQTIIESFQNMVPRIIQNKVNPQNNSFFDKILASFKKLVIIRKISEVNPKTIDYQINQIEKLLNQHLYREALEALSSLDKSYFEITQEFVEKLTLFVQIKNSDEEIIKYLKNLS